MVKEFLVRLTIMKENSTREAYLVMELINTRRVISMRENGKTRKEMVEEVSEIKVGRHIMVHGEII